MTGLQAVWVCNLVSFLSFPRSSELQLSGVKLVWNGVAGSALVSLWSLKDVFLWSYCFRKTTTASPCRYLAKSFPLQTGWGSAYIFNGCQAREVWLFPFYILLDTAHARPDRIYALTTLVTYSSSMTEAGESSLTFHNQPTNSAHFLELHRSSFTGPWGLFTTPRRSLDAVPVVTTRSCETPSSI